MAETAHPPRADTADTADPGSLEDRFRSGGVEALALWPLERDDGAAAATVRSVLVPGGQLSRARAALDATPWRYQLGATGGWRTRATVLVTYDDRAPVVLHGRLPLGLLPARAVRRLERALLGSASSDGPGLHRPADPPLAVHLAVQCCRPAPLHHRSDWAHLCTLLEDEVLARRAAQVAAELGLTAALRAAQAAAQGSGRPPSGAVPFDGALAGSAWRVARRACRHLGGSRPGRWLAGEVALGEAPGRARFAGVELRSRPPVFPPTPPTEPMVHLASERLADRSDARPVVVDLGTGCGAVALALAVRWPAAEIHATDVSRPALRAARRNARLLGVRNVELHRGSLLDPLPRSVEGSVDVLLANLPYYPEDRYVRAGDVARDAIQGSGPDGLGFYRAVVARLPDILRPGGAAVMQMFGWQWERLQAALPEALRAVDETPHLDFVLGTLEKRGDSHGPRSIPGPASGGRP